MPSAVRIVCVCLPFILSIAAAVVGVILVIPTADKPVLRDLYFVRINSSSIKVGGDAAIGALVTSLAQSVGLADFYSSGLWNSCNGKFINKTKTDTGFNITSCTKPSIDYYFNPVQTLEQQLLQGYTINVPSEVTAALASVKKLSKGLFAGYIGGTAASVVEIFVGLFAFASKWGSGVTAVVGILACILYVAAAVIATVMFSEIVNAFNGYAGQFGVTASIGKQVLVLSWVAVALSGAAAFFWIFTCCCGRTTRTRRSTEADYTPMLEKPSQFQQQPYAQGYSQGIPYSHYGHGNYSKY